MRLTIDVEEADLRELERLLEIELGKRTDAETNQSRLLMAAVAGRALGALTLHDMKARIFNEH